MKNNKLWLVFALVFVLFLSACGGANEEKENQNEKSDEKTEAKHQDGETNHSEMEEEDHSMMDHSSSGEVPDELKDATNPTYEVGSEAIIEDGHMQGMKGAVATIVGAYDTTAYIVTYTPTNGGKPVKDHKWVIQEEIENVDSEMLKPGTEVILEADHMEGMEGAKATIDSGEKTTVYMIDYESTTDGQEVKNHKWVVESELAPK